MSKEKSIINVGDGYFSFNGLGDWKVCIVKNIPDGEKSHLIFRRGYRKNIVSRHIGGIRHHFMGSLNEKGRLVALALGEDMPYFGKNIQNAVRYLYLKTQKPLPKRRDSA